MPAIDKPDSPLPPTTVKWRFPSVHPEGRKFVVIAAALALVAYTGSAGISSAGCSSA